MNTSLNKLIDDKLELLTAVLKIPDEEGLTEEIDNLIDDKDITIAHKMDMIKSVIEMMDDMVIRNKSAISDTKYAIERIELRKARLHKSFHDSIKYRLEQDSIHTANYKFIPKVYQKRTVSKLHLKESELFVNIKLMKKDWDKISELVNEAVVVISVKDVYPTVTELGKEHPAIETELTEYVQWRVNTNKLDNTNKIE